MEDHRLLHFVCKVPKGPTQIVPGLASNGQSKDDPDKETDISVSKKILTP